MIERPRRFLYVTRTRAEESLALAVYPDDPAAVEKFLIDKNRFNSGEIVTLN